ncbi:MAG: SpoIID/LytB domain-containing protein [Chloroflexota bacterium]
MISRLTKVCRVAAVMGVLGASSLPVSADAQALTMPAAVYQFSDPGQTLVFEGRGWGHGVGLCQWGARGRALAGQTAEQIVSAYYTGATVQKAVSPETTLRVLIHANFQPEGDQIGRITGSGGRWQLEGSGVAVVQAPAGAFLELSAEGGAPRYHVKDATGTVLGGAPLGAPIVARPLEGGTRFVVGYKPAPDVRGRPGVFQDTYRGEVIVSPRSGGIETVNRLSLEDYLRGVVPAEMPASWPSEAVKAQTLAARSYAVFQARARSSERYDVDDTTSFQVYRGANAEHPVVNQIVDATAGQVIMHGSQIVQAYFFSTCGGWTENNESVWQSGQPLPYLRGIRDVDASGKAYDAESPLATWSTGPLSVAQLEEILNGHEATEIGTLRSIDLSRRTASGRLLTATLVGSAGTKTVRSDTLTARFNRGKPEGLSQLFSTLFDLKWAPGAVVAPPLPMVPTAPSLPAARTATPGPATTSRPVPTSTLAPTPTPALRLEMTNAVAARPNGPSSQFFVETGHNVGGAFLDFFQRSGGLDIFGFPRTEELLEDGRTVQYFQRAKLEYHVDKVGTPYDVQLALLGDTLTLPRRPFSNTAAFASTAEHVFFPETSHGLHYGFLNYWRNRGGLDVFGYPISEELQEGGHTVQHFQRARFEYHPEHAGTRYDVQLGLLGDQLLQQRSWLK